MKINQMITDCQDLILELHGEFDALGSAEIRQELEAIALQTKPELVFLDLQNVTFVDSSGVGAIVFLYKRLRENSRKLKITGAHGQPRELLELLRIHKAIPVALGSEVVGGSEAASCVG
jgi:anti-anti-sigma factor